MANQWFRMYSEFATDPKVQMMSEAYQRRFIMVLCLRCSNAHVTLHDTEVAFQLRISNEEWLETKAVFIAKGLIDDDNTPTAWDKRQFASDSSAERVARHREKKKQEEKLRNVTVTPPDTDTDTDISTTDVVDKATAKKQPRFDAHRHLMSVGIDKQLADDWLAVRKAKKAAPTKTAIDGIASEANKAGISLAEALAICCQRGWASFKDSWDWRQQGVGQPARPVNGRQAAISNYAAQAAAARGGYESASNVRDITGESCRVA